MLAEDRIAFDLNQIEEHFLDFARSPRNLRFASTFIKSRSSPPLPSTARSRARDTYIRATLMAV